jgi:hypothetical protein
MIISRTDISRFDDDDVLEEFSFELEVLLLRRGSEEVENVSLRESEVEPI